MAEDLIGSIIDGSIEGKRGAEMLKNLTKGTLPPQEMMKPEHNDKEECD